MIGWALSGAALGATLAVVALAPAAWLADAVARASEQRLLLADARGTVWSGSAVPVLTGGAGSHDASALPGRLQWRLGFDAGALALRATHACCLNGEMLLRWSPGWARSRFELTPPPGPAGAPGVIGHWPAAWLVGLGTPWNTLQPSGSIRIASPGLAVESVQGRWLFSGRAEIDLESMASRISTLDELGSYRLVLQGDAAQGEAASVQLSTLRGALQLSGQGEWAASKLRFQGQAGAAAGSEAVLNNLLNIIGRRQGALSVISIG
ncbi:MAG TPA: type II secretion system protein N [Rubrivivax sp.]|nr:type II secretion system protein N [Rubrivivax sp.]